MARQDLDDVSERTSVSLVSCRRQFDNLKRVMKAVPSRRILFPLLPANAVQCGVHERATSFRDCARLLGVGWACTTLPNERTQVALGEPDPTDPELFDASRTVYEARLPRSAFAQAVTVARAHGMRTLRGWDCVRTDGPLRMGSRRAAVPRRR